MLRSLAIVAVGTTAVGAGMLAGFLSGAAAGGALGTTAACFVSRLRDGRGRAPGPLSERREPYEE